MNLNCHILRKGVDVDTCKIKRIFDCSCEWFDVTPETNGVQPSMFSEWIERLDNKHGEILYAELPSIDSSDKIRVAGFIFSYVRDNCNDSRHIWLAITNPLYLRLGIMSKIFRILDINYPSIELTVNTYPNKFPNMPYFLEHCGYHLIEKHCAHNSDGEKWSYSKVNSTSDSIDAVALK